MNEYVCSKELAQLLGVTPHTISNWRRKKKIPQPRIVGKTCVYRLAEVLEAIRRNKLHVDPVAAEALNQQ